MQRTSQEQAFDEAIGTAVADAGYCSEDNLKADGPNRLLATGKSHKMAKQDVHDGPPPHGATPGEANAWRLRTEEGRAIYSKRQHMIEPVFGHTKANRGFRHFVRRGIAAAEAEWLLMMSAQNITKLYLREQRNGIGR